VVVKVERDPQHVISSALDVHSGVRGLEPTRNGYDHPRARSLARKLHRLVHGPDHRVAQLHVDPLVGEGVLWRKVRIGAISN
jgi:hypothetical protein